MAKPKEKPYITAKAWAVAQDWQEKAGVVDVDAVRTAQAQVAVDLGVALNDILDAPAGKHSDAVSGYMRAFDEQALKSQSVELTENDDGSVSIGGVTIREPLGRDLSLGVRAGISMSVLATIVKCANTAPEVVERLPYEQYAALEGWMGGFVGLGETQ